MEQMFLANGALMIVAFLSGCAKVPFSLETLDHLGFRSSKWITFGNERLQKNILGMFCIKNSNSITNFQILQSILKHFSS